MNSKCIGSKFIHISSRNRTYGSQSDFTVNIPSDVFENKLDNQYLKLNLQEITLNRSWYNVSEENENNTFTLYSANDNVIYEITLESGSYNVNQLKDALNKLLDKEYVVSYNSITNKYTFTASNPNNYIEGGVAEQLLGLEYGVNHTGTFTSTRPVDMTSINTVYLHSDIAKVNEIFDNLNNKVMAGSTILARIPISVAPFSNINYTNYLNTNDGIKLAVKQLDSIRFFLTDERGNKLNLTSNFTMVLKLEIFLV